MVFKNKTATFRNPVFIVVFYTGGLFRISQSMDLSGAPYWVAGGGGGILKKYTIIYLRIWIPIGGGDTLILSLNMVVDSKSQVGFNL